MWYLDSVPGNQLWAITTLKDTAAITANTAAGRSLPDVHALLAQGNKLITISY